MWGGGGGYREMLLHSRQSRGQFSDFSKLKDVCSSIEKKIIF